MTLGKTILKLRKQAKLSQEAFAQLCGVSRQAVQKWETETSMPDVNNLVQISKLFGITLDFLVRGSSKRETEQSVFDKKIEPKYTSLHDWDCYHSQLLVEYKQSIEEGKDIGQYGDLFAAAAKMSVCSAKIKMADVLFDLVLNASVVSGYQYIEPSELEQIKSLRQSTWKTKTNKPDKDILCKKISGAWMGRICGCLLGKPIECIKTQELWPILKKSDNYPMHRYINSMDITDEMCKTYSFDLKDKCYADTVGCAPCDDDTNYTVMAAKLIEKHGRDFTSRDVAQLWLELQPKSAYCTAERVAFNNFVNGYFPPDSAIYKNPYREWIGAQIRGDYFGYVNPGDPETAAEMAWRDASISHVKNGIYGEMFVAAMIACAAVEHDMIKIILGGLGQIPTTSRLHKQVMQVVADYQNGVDTKRCFVKIHNRFDEHNEHDWCHTIPNALIVVSALLYGEDDFGKSICLAVQTGFDTDCNGATVGSIMGMKNGIDSISKQWTAPVGDALETAIFGVGRVKISDMVQMTIKQIQNI